MGGWAGRPARYRTGALSQQPRTDVVVLKGEPRATPPAPSRRDRDPPFDPTRPDRVRDRRGQPRPRPDRRPPRPATNATAHQSPGRWSAKLKRRFSQQSVSTTRRPCNIMITNAVAHAASRGRRPGHRGHRMHTCTRKPFTHAHRPAAVRGGLRPPHARAEGAPRGARAHAILLGDLRAAEHGGGVGLRRRHVVAPKRDGRFGHVDAALARRHLERHARPLHVVRAV